METDEIKTCENNDEELNQFEDQENLEEGEALDYTNKMNQFHEKKWKITFKQNSYNRFI